MASRLHDTRAATVATVCASAMIASHVAGKAARDALFLSNFDVSFLPFMLIVSAVLSMVLVLASSRLLSRRGPSRLIPGAFALSAVLLLGEWMLLRTHSRAATVLLYMHMASLGGVLISGFWSVVNERFDPRTAKRHIGRIAAGGTADGFIGGILAERVSVTLTVPTMIPIVAMLHVLCAVTVRSVGRLPNVLLPSEGDKQSGAENAFRILRQAPYLRTIAPQKALSTLLKRFWIRW